MMNEALEYLKRGMSVIPLAKDKRPLMPWQDFQTRRANEEEVKTWLKKWPDMNIGIVTGKISNLTVIDCDSEDAITYFREGYKNTTPCVKTPKGMHFYFQYQDGVRNTARLTDHIDVRSEGGYVVAPPSINDKGLAYAFIKDLSLALDSFINCFLYKEYDEKKSSFSSNVVNFRQSSSTLFELGRRDEDLFHIANCMVKGGASLEYVSETLRRVIASWGEQDEKWISAKISSAIQRAERRERNLTQEITDFVNSSSGVFFSSEVDNFLHCSSLAEKKNASQIFRRLAKEGIIEKAGTKNGCWRKVETDIEIIDWQNAKDDEYVMRWPLNIHELVKLYPGNIAVVAGASNTGKTSFMLEVIRLNQAKHKVTYFNSEMAASELRIRLQQFGEICPLNKWNFKAVERSSNFADVIDPDGMNVIDFLEVYDEFWKIGLWIRDIHARLKNGVAIIAIQKKGSTKEVKNDFGRGGELTLEKPRLYLSMDRGKIKIIKGKIWRSSDRNPNGLVKRFKLVGGWKWIHDSEWISEDEDDKYAKQKSYATYGVVGATDEDFPHED